MTFLLNREPQNREPQKPQTPWLTAKTALSFYHYNILGLPQRLNFGM
jgi:hypothetical protein